VPHELTRRGDNDVWRKSARHGHFLQLTDSERPRQTCAREEAERFSIRDPAHDPFEIAILTRSQRSLGGVLHMTDGIDDARLSRG
jgi:hypothetical protein